MAESLTVGVNGANGFLGRNLVKSLRLKDHSVRELTSSPKNSSQDCIDFPELVHLEKIITK